MKGGETKICGLAAVRARFRRDASSIVRLFFDQPTSRKVGVMRYAVDPIAAERLWKLSEQLLGI